MSVEVAAFDVDGTLTVRDCVLPFLRRVGGVRALSGAMIRSPRSLLTDLVRRDRDQIKKRFVRAAFAGQDVERVNELGVAFAYEVSEQWMRADVAARLRWHQREGHAVVLVSASLGPYLTPLGDMLGVDAVLCTELEESGGRFTGELMGANCRGEEKVRRLASWSKASGLGDVGPTYAYGDSAGDAHMLRSSVHGFNVRKTDVPEWSRT